LTETFVQTTNQLRR